ncbi:hypothetical protein Tco_0834871 [Tanacetum coccineum]
MVDLIFAHSHNMVAYLEKSEDNIDFAEIVEFLNASPISSKSTAWNEFGTNIALVVICLAKKQRFNSSKLIFDVFNDEYDTPFHTKKVFANIRRKGKDFSGTVTPLFATMLIQSQAVEGEDKTLHEERGESVERATTTSTSLDAEQGSGNINRTQSTAVPNDPFPQGISSGVNTLGSGEDSMKLQELMDLCTKLSYRVLDLENVKDALALEIKKLKKRVKKLERNKKSRTPQLKRRLFKVRIESSAEKSLGDQEDASKQERNEIDQDEGISYINITTAKPITTASTPVATAGIYVSTAKPSTPPPPTTATTTPFKDEDLTIAQTLMKMKIPPPQIDSKDKGKAKMVEPEKPKKKKDQIEYDADVAQRLQAKLDEEARLEREREKEASKASNIAEWDDVQAMMDADYELAAKL